MIESILQYWPLVVIALIVIAILVLARLYSGPKRLPYQARNRIMTQSEVKFFRQLQKAVQDEFLIFTMVRIADLMVVESGVPKRRVWLNKILAKHVDFVLCDNGTLQPLLAIELDDRSHDRPERQERDAFVEHAFESAGLKLLRIKTADGYDPRELRSLIDKLLH
ncbi:MAG: DUF2726 domain-containing protein [Pirellulaceae bacterium]